MDCTCGIAYICVIKVINHNQKLIKMTTQNTYTVIFNNINDCRTVISNVDYRTALSVYTDTKNHRRFFQDDLTKEEKNSGVVTLYRDADEKTIYETPCRRVRK